MPQGIINQSNELRKLIFQQSERYNIPLTHLCYHIGIDYKRFVSGYANIKDLSNTSPEISDQQLMDISKMLGLDVRMVIVIKDENKFNENVPDIKNMLKDEYSKKKGVITKAERIDKISN